ncbi:VOC family protein [Robertkochia marina]|uniref:VOC family protein n=1 Tax=Robertkochia marina TaxID=1227945 RepID=A0A4S3M0I2_9FLAO|nr:VOC family protein [Robertkochia marina]THD67483.1 VOC family protein [Robertkochia marina]TRZ44649.1 VOC family protein [Robertkochia marina]
MVTWFEIPTADIERAKAFYEEVLQITIGLHDINGLKMAWFPEASEKGVASGSLIQQESYIPSKEGVLVYLSCSDINAVLDRVEKAGGSVYQPRTMISEEYGFMGVFIDSEGNRIALHSNH